MMRFFLPFLLSLSAACYLFPILSFKAVQADWVRVNLANAVSISFPERPTAQDAGNGIQLYKVVRPEAVYMVIYLDHKSEAGLEKVTEANPYQFYLGMMNSMVRNDEGSLTDSASFTVGDLRGLDFSYTAQEANGTVVKRHNRVLFRKNMVYSLLYTPLMAVTDSSRTAEERFLRSIEISKD